MKIQTKSVPISKGLIAKIFKYTWNGQSLNRALRDYATSLIPMNGRILDLGSGKKRGHINASNSSITYSDYYKLSEGMIKINLEEPFNIDKESYDTITCLSVLEHILNYKNVIKESYRILRHNGYFIGYIPFLHCFHPDPCDYFRFTEHAITEIFSEEGFICREINYLGYGIFTAIFCLLSGNIPRVINGIVAMLMICFDLLINRITRIKPSTYALGYIFVFEKE